MITSLDQLDFKKQYSYADYIKWKFQDRVELFKGWIFPMAAPNVVHQTISGNLYWVLASYFRKEKQPCKLFAAPFDVRLPLPKNKVKGDKITTVIQPDLCVVCDTSKLDKQGCVGAPDLIVEILSPGNSKREMRDKYELYEEAGVLEYWVIDPARRHVLTYRLKDGQFVSASRPLSDEDTLTAIIFEDLKIDLTEVFPEEETEE